MTAILHYYSTPKSQKHDLTLSVILIFCDIRLWLYTFCVLQNWPVKKWHSTFVGLGPQDNEPKKINNLMVIKYKVGIQIPDQSGIWMVPGLLIEWYQLPANRGPNSTSVNKANIARLSPKPRHYFKDYHRSIEICPNFLLGQYLWHISYSQFIEIN